MDWFSGSSPGVAGSFGFGGSSTGVGLLAAGSIGFGGSGCGGGGLTLAVSSRCLGGVTNFYWAGALVFV